MKQSKRMMAALLAAMMAAGSLPSAFAAELELADDTALETISIDDSDVSDEGIPYAVMSDYTDDNQALTVDDAEEESVVLEEEADAQSITVETDNAKPEAVDGYYYATVNMEYADFFYGELNNVKADETIKSDGSDQVAAYRETGMYDAVTSATSSKSTRYATAYYESGVENDEGKTETTTNLYGIKDVRIKVPAAVYDAVMAETDATGTMAKVQEYLNNATYSDTAFDTEYKQLNADGTFSAMISQEGAQTVDGASASVSTSSAWGDYEISVEGIDDIKPTTENLYGIILTDKDGNNYGMLHSDNTWVQTQKFSWAVDDMFTEPHGNHIPYQRTNLLKNGNTITQIRYLVKDSADLVISTNLYLKQLIEATGTAVSQSTTTDGTQVQLTLSGAPTDANYTIGSVVKGARHGKTVDPSDYSYNASTGILTLSKNCEVGSDYVVTMTSDKYGDIKIASGVEVTGIYAYAAVPYSEYYAAESGIQAASDTTSSAELDAKGETDKGAFDAVTRATANHGLHRGNFQQSVTIYDTDGNAYQMSHWDSEGKNIILLDGSSIGFSRGTITKADGSTAIMESYKVTGIKYVPVSVAAADFEDFKTAYSVVENGGELAGGYSEVNLQAYSVTANVTENTNGLKVVTKNADGSFSFGERKTGTDSGIADQALKTVDAASVPMTVKEASGSYGEFLRVDFNGSYGDLGANMQAAVWKYYGTDSSNTTPIGIYGTKFAADNWMHKSNGIQLGLTNSLRCQLPEGYDGTGYWTITIYALGYEDYTTEKFEVTDANIVKPVEETVDTSALDALIQQAEGLNEASYTAESWAAMKAELDESKELLKMENLTQAMVDEQVTHMTDAINSLVERVQAEQTITTSKTSYSVTYGSSAFSLGAKTSGDGKLTYKSSNTSVATVNASGKVTVKGVGTATITINAAETEQYKAASKTVKVTVAKAAQTITAKSYNKVYGNKAFSLGAKTNGDGKLTYKSSKTSVATVDASGKVTIKGVGTATITINAAATAKYKAASKTVKVTVAKAAQTITAKSYTKAYGAKAFSLGAKTSGNGKLTYKSSKTSVATVNASGKVTIKGVGTATITVSAAATSKYKAATKKVTITVNPQSTSISNLKNVSGKKMKVKWTKRSSASKYEIQYATNKSFKNAKKATASASSATISKLTKGKTYYVRVRGYKTINGKTYYASWSTAKTVKITK